MQDSSVAQPKSLGYKLKSARSKQTTHETESGMSTIRSTYSSIPNTKARHRTKQFSLQYTNPAFRNGLSDIMNHGATSGVGDAGVIHAHHRVPEFISSIVLKLSETSATPGCIPTELESAIHTCSDGIEHIPVEAYASNPDHTETSHLLTTVRKIYAAANIAYNRHEDEEAWSDVVQFVLRCPTELSPIPLLELVGAKNKAICHELLPLMGQVAISV
jgi:hypothetical protein